MALTRIFAIYDPTSSNEALNSLILTLGRQRNTTVTAYCAVFSPFSSDSLEELETQDRLRYQLWLEKLTEPLRETGVEVAIKIDWGKDWKEAVLARVSECNCDVIIKNSYSHKDAMQHKYTKSLDRPILKAAKVPVYLIRCKEAHTNPVMLAALKIRGLEDPATDLNRKIVALAKSAAQEGATTSQVHAVSVYEGSENHIPRNKLAEVFGISHNDAHTYDMSPVEGIVHCAKEINANVTVLGYEQKEKPGLLKYFWGSTVETLLETLPTDMICFVDNKENS